MSGGAAVPDPVARTALVALAAVAALAGLSACSTADTTTATTASTNTRPITVSPTAGRTGAAKTNVGSTPTGSGPGEGDLRSVPALALLLDAAAPLWRYSVGDDRLGVWICHVALDIDDATYNDADLRLELTPDGVADILDEHVATYYRDISHGRYRPDFVAEGEVSIDANDSSRDCVQRALQGSGDDIGGVVVIADAEHAANQPGGWGRPGDTCAGAAPTVPCPARETGRATYIGASDFHPDWGAIPAVDLQEHELGHSLGLPHSGDDNRHTSALDLMSNSAAPRDVDPDRRHAPDTLAVNRLALGWLDPDGVAIAPAGGDTYTLAPSTGTTGVRLLVLALDDQRFITVELIDNTGYNAHLPEPGIAIHLVDQRPEACGHSSAGQPCVNELRRQAPMLGPSPHTDLLGRGQMWSGEGWTVTVIDAGDSGWTVTVS